MTHTGHPNDMTQWSEIRCQMGHERHDTRIVRVDLSKPHGYTDCPVVPERFHRAFDLAIYDHRTYRKATRYCPAHDAVSETIDSHGIWEPAETILTLSACSAAPQGSWMVDYGSQIGWFSMLAMTCGLKVHAIDAEHENMRVLIEESAAGYGSGYMEGNVRRVGVDPFALGIGSGTPVAMAKIDLEGAENLALAELARMDSLVPHLLVEISPVFADYYPDLVCDLIDAGYHAWQVPEKSQPRPVLDKLPHDLGVGFHEWPEDELRSWIAAQHQFNAWFALPEAAWG